VLAVVSDSPCSVIRSSSIPTESFPKSVRLLKRVDFKRVERGGARKVSEHFVVVARHNSFDFPRLGTTVSRKVGNAVVRNRWKRRLREIFRRNRDAFPPGFDYVVIVRKVEHQIEPAFATLATELIDVLKGAGRRAARLENGGEDV